MRIPDKYKTFYYRYVWGHTGWECEIKNNPLSKGDAKQFARDVLCNIGALFKRHKTYINRENYRLTIMPYRGILGILNFMFLPVYLLHELTHALAIYLGLSLKWIILLPMVTESPFFVMGIVMSYFELAPFWVTIPLLFVGYVGCASLGGDYPSYKWFKQSYEEIPDLSTLLNQ